MVCHQNDLEDLLTDWSEERSVGGIILKYVSEEHYYVFTYEGSRLCYSLTDLRYTTLQYLIQIVCSFYQSKLLE